MTQGEKRKGKKKQEEEEQEEQQEEEEAGLSETKRRSLYNNYNLYICL